MKKKTQLLTGILSLVFFTQMHAAIVHTDMTDATLKKDPNAQAWENAELTIDLDNDGTPDFKFETHMIAKMAYNGADIVTVSTNEWDVIKGLDLNTSIDANAGFYAAIDAYLNAGWGTYVFPSNLDKYLGVRFMKNTNTYYGWIKIELSGDEIIFKEYAYESVAGTAIKAGDKGNITPPPTTSAISNSSAAIDVKMYPNPASKALYIEAQEMLTEISILDLTGLVVKNITSLSTSSTTIIVDDLQAGLYYLIIRSGSKSMNGKFYKN